MFKQESFLNSFIQKGWPTTKDEAWKYTSLKDLQNQKFDVAAKVTSYNFQNYLDSLSFLKSQVVFVDGYYNAKLSRLPEHGGVDVQSIATLINDGSTDVYKELESFDHEKSLSLLNTGSFKDGVIIKIDSELKETLGLVYITTQKQVQNHIRNIIHMAPHSKAKILKCFKGFDQVYFNNILTTVTLEAEASLHLYKVQEESSRAYHVSNTEVIQKSKSHFESHLQTFGGQLCRNEISVKLIESHATTELYGLYAANSQQHVDNFTYIDHAVSDCKSNELYKGILDGKAHGVFSGQVLVRPDAQKTDARQANKNLLLSEDAQIDTKPQLMIHADDVKCAHGATIGQLDKAAVFYLQSRGIDQNQARMILTRAFAVEMIEKITDEKMKEYFDRVLQIWFNHQTLH